jgi:diguanylate cyclase (GGDEF)-like protein/PAS domain S-box-containing protein/hemerythrin-like metal-binding protein
MLDDETEAKLHEPAERYRVLFTKAKIPMLLIDPQSGAIVEANEAACRYYGYHAQQLESMRITDINTFTAQQVQEEMQRAAEEQRSHFFFRHRLANGDIRDVEVHSGPLVIGGRPLLYSVINDISERRAAERQLKESEARFRHVMEHAPLGISIADLHGRFTEVNQALCDIVGYAREELQRMSIDDITHPADLAISRKSVRSLLEGREPAAKYEKRYLHKSGATIWMQISVSLERDWAGAPLYFIQLAEDISRRKEVERRISFLAHHDRLTELPNRDLFLDRLSGSISRARRKHKLLALFFLDLDGFKAVNDNFGHEAGDAVLKMVARHLLASVRDVDTVARLGGDEFAIIFDEIEHAQDVAAVARKIIQRLAAPFVLPDKGECSIGVSIGIAIYPDNGAEIDRLMSAADDAMYASKRRGRNNYTYFEGAARGYASNHPWITLDEAHRLGEPEIDRQHQELANLLNELNDAVRENRTSEFIAQLFDDLIAYAEGHFAMEEQLMEKYAYPERGIHKNEHQRLIREAHYLKEKLGQGGELLVLQSLKDWLLAHTMHVDKPFVEYLHRRGVA